MTPEKSDTVSVNLVNDTVGESEEQFTVTLTFDADELRALPGEDMATGTIYDDDGKPPISITGATADRGRGPCLRGVVGTPHRHRRDCGRRHRIRH